MNFFDVFTGNRNRYIVKDTDKNLYLNFRVGASSFLRTNNDIWVQSPTEAYHFESKDNARSAAAERSGWLPWSKNCIVVNC